MLVFPAILKTQKSVLAAGLKDKDALDFWVKLRVAAGVKSIRVKNCRNYLL